MLSDFGDSYCMYRACELVHSLTWINIILQLTQSSALNWNKFLENSLGAKQQWEYQVTFSSSRPECVLALINMQHSCPPQISCYMSSYFKLSGSLDPRNGMFNLIWKGRHFQIPNGHIFSDMKLTGLDSGHAPGLKCNLPQDMSLIDLGNDN